MQRQPNKLKREVQLGSVLEPKPIAGYDRMGRYCERKPAPFPIGLVVVISLLVLAKVWL